MSFLLAVVKFYLPDFAIGSITPVPFHTQDILLTGATSYFSTSSVPFPSRKREQSCAWHCRDAQESCCAFSAEHEYKAEADLWLCPQTRLLADSPDATDFVYDGQGHRLILPEGISDGEALPVIIVGAGKTLLLRDVKIVHAESLPACLQLGSGKLHKHQSRTTQ